MDDAGRQLANALAAWRGKRPIVYAIPRGAVPMGKVIADALEGELDVVLTRKLGAPGNPEFAIGAVDETGWSYVAEYADEVVCLQMPTFFYAVGQLYRDFGQVDDAEIVALLRAAAGSADRS